MAKEDTQDLLRFLDPFDENVRELALWLRAFIWNLYPQANELIYDNYNALAVGWSPTDKQSHIFCSFALYRPSGKAHFGFYWGNELADPENRLLGKGKQYRYLQINGKEDLPKSYVKKLMKEAWANSLCKVKDPGQLNSGKTIVKMSLVHKRERSPAQPGKKTTLKKK